VPIELRRLLIGDPFGDYNFLRFPSETAPTQFPYAGGIDYLHTVEKWVQAVNAGSFLGGIRSLHLRFLRVSYGATAGGLAVSHNAPAFGCGAVARFGLGSDPILGGAYILGNPYGRVSVTPTSANTFYTLRWSEPAQKYWRVSVWLPAAGGTQDLDEVRLWEFIDIEPYLEDLIPSDADTEVFQMPQGRYFVGTHYRWTSKRLTITLLFSRTNTTLRKQLENLLTKPSPRYPLELYVDGYLFRCACSGLRFEPVGGMVVRAVIELQLLRPYAYHENRYLTISPPTYPSDSAPIALSVGNDLIAAETPCEIRVNPGSAINGYKIRVTVAPSGQKAVYRMEGTEGGKLIVFHESGKVFLADKGIATTITDVTDRVEITSQLPFSLQSPANSIYVEYLDSNNNPISDTTLWQVSVAFNPRSGEVVVL